MIAITYWGQWVKAEAKFPSTIVADIPDQCRIVVKGGQGMKKAQSYLSALGYHGAEFEAISGYRAMAGKAALFQRGEVQNYGTFDPETDTVAFSDDPQPLPEDGRYLKTLARMFGGPYPIPEPKQPRVCDECQSDISHRGNQSTKCVIHAKQAARKLRRERTKLLSESVEND